MVARVTAAMLVVLAMAVALPLQPQPAQVSASQAKLIYLYGDVQTRHGSGAYQKAVLNEVLKPGEGIKTGAGARAQLSLGNGQYVRMDERSQLLITHVQSNGLTSFKTLVGGVWVTIEKALGAATKFEVHTPSVVAAARGTIFRCAVEESGETEVYVYDGEVEVSDSDGTVRVAPEQWCRARRGMKLAAVARNADEDERRDFVKYNRNCDVLQQVGSPQVIVALSVAEQTKPQAALRASDALMEDLRQSGFIAAPLRPEHLREATYDQRGWLKPKGKLADYYIVGTIQVRREPPRPHGRGAGTATARAYLVGAEDYRRVMEAEATVPFQLPPSRPSVTPEVSREMMQAALAALGHQMAKKFAPRMMHELLTDRPQGVRVDLQGTVGPEQMWAVKSALAAPERGVRVWPLARTEDGVSVAVSGGLTPEGVAQALGERAGAIVQSVSVSGRVVTVVLRQGAPPPQ